MQELKYAQLKSRYYDYNNVDNCINRGIMKEKQQNYI